MRFVSITGGGGAVDFETAVLRGFADDGGLFAPVDVPRVGPEKLEEWADLSYVDLAFEILSLFIDRSIIPGDELRSLIDKSFVAFEHPGVIPVKPLDKGRGLYVMELFHGPTLSFKDVAMGFLINTMDFFLKRRGKRISLLFATTGDTGPAAASAVAGKETMECWALYPEGMTTGEQERQMSTLEAPNVHAVRVTDCPDGVDDLDLTISRLFADERFKEEVKLSSVNSINWCRVMVQTVHYFYGYFRVVGEVGGKVAFSTPSGAFGNLFGGCLARAMGLPVEMFICANNKNATLHEVFTNGVFSREDLRQSLSSAMDIVAPYNFWRFLYFASGRDSGKIRQWMSDFQKKGRARLDAHTFEEIRRGFTSASISDEQTLAMMAKVFREQNGYLLDPHAAVAAAAAEEASRSLGEETSVVCLATAHPAKFPDVVRAALSLDGDFPDAAVHPSIEASKDLMEHVRLCKLGKLDGA
ncbi:MAG: threonine synthase, partial [Desulfobacterales bacterium]|nr:threonine synthase [Desulfobacterales bacterium]